MKKIALSLLTLFGFLTNQAQEGEIKYNVLNTIILGSVEIGYEHFIDGTQSIGLDLLINDRFSYSSESRNRGRIFNTNSLAASYNFYISPENNGSGWMISPFFKYRFGNFEERKTVENISNIIVKTNMNSAILGLTGGHKWILNKLAIAPYASIARNFSKEVNNRFSAIEFTAGFSIGYRL